MTRIHLVGFHVAPQLLGLHAAAVRTAHPEATVTRLSVVASPGATGQAPARVVRQDADLLLFRAPAQFGILSGAYAWFVAQLRERYGSLAHAVSVDLHGPGIDENDVTIVVGWSAGGAFVREMCGEELPPERWGLVSCDGSYGELVRPGLAAEASVRPWVEFARRGGVLAANATHLDYVETLPQPYASTRTVLHQVVAELEDDRGTWQLVTLTHADHVRACRDDGPPLTAWVATQCLEALGRASCTATSSPATEPPEPTLREGARGPAVIAVQRIVAVAQDGVWGPLTTHAVLAWRAAHGLPSGAWWDAQCQAVADSEPQLYQVRGADVSRAQGDGAANAWDRWGVDFGFARSSSGVTVDPTFAGNWHGMSQLVVRGAYHYVNGRSVDDQLDAIMRAMLPLTHPEDMPVALDIEPWDPQSRVTPDWIAAMASGIPVELARRLRDIGCNVGVYTGAWAIDAVPGLTAALLALDPWWWIADGSGAAIAAWRPTHLPRGVPLERVLFWQRGRFAAAGEPLPIDEDRWRGSLDALRSFARG